MAVGGSADDPRDWYRQPQGLDFDVHDAINDLVTRYEPYSATTAGWLSNLAHNVYGRVLAFPDQDVDSTSVRMLVEGFLAELHAARTNGSSSPLGEPGPTSGEPAP